MTPSDWIRVAICANARKPMERNCYWKGEHTTERFAIRQALRLHDIERKVKPIYHGVSYGF